MFEDMVASELQALGYAIIRQHWVPNRGDGKRGKVDLVAEKGPVRAAIELDRRSPRQKSIFKVNQVKDATFRVVFCREEKRSET